MSVSTYVAQLRAMADAPSAEKARALVQTVRAEPGVTVSAKPLLLQDPRFADAYRTVSDNERYEYHNTSMPMPRAIKTPSNLTDLLQVVQRAADASRALKAMGDGYGFANAAATPDWLVHCFALENELPLEAETFVAGVDASSLVRVQAGMTFNALNTLLASRGRALMQQPGFGGLTVMGCASAGGHGSGLSLQGISSYLEAVELVTLNDQNQVRLVRIEPSQGFTDRAKWAQKYAAPTFDLAQDDGLFHAVRCGQGQLGIVYAVTVRTQPRFFLDETRTFTTWNQARPLINQKLVDPDVHSVHVWVNPYRIDGRADQTVVITELRKTTATQASGERGIGIRIDGLSPINEMIRALASVCPKSIVWLMDEALKSTCASNVVMPCSEALDFGGPNSTPVFAASLGFDAAKVDAVFPALMQQIDSWSQHGAWITSPLGMRWVKASQDHLSPQFGRDTVMLEVPILKGTPNATATLDAYANYMMDTWDARPHWGQQNPMTRAQFEKVYAASLMKFLPAFRTLNPNGFFDGALARQIGLRALANG